LTTRPFIIKGKVVNYRKEGKWKRSISSENHVINIENYKGGKLINGRSFSMMYSEEKYNDKIFCVIEPPLSFVNAENFQINKCYPITKSNLEYATYPGGMFNFYREIKAAFAIPEQAILSGRTGTIVIQTTISA
jgi:hypothetical protein